MCMWCGYYDGNEKSKKRGNIKVDKIFSKCGMRCDLCLIYRPNVQENDRRKEICIVYITLAVKNRQCLWLFG